MIIPILVMLHLFETPAEVREQCLSVGTDSSIGCAVPRGSQCHVYMLKPQIGYRQDLVIAHEVAHCFFGDTHGG